MENRSTCQDVSYKWIEWKAKSILEEDRFYAVGRDITHLCTSCKKISDTTHLCTSCKKIRDDMGNWNHIEAYTREHYHAEFTHCICPECAKKFIWNLFNN